MNRTQFVYAENLKEKVLEFIVPVATTLTLHVMASDDPQSRRVNISHKGEPGIPALGCRWSEHVCNSSSFACNSVLRNFTFLAPAKYARKNITVCFEALNDQGLCPMYERNAGIQPYGHHFGPGINGSRKSESLCVLLRISGPIIEWITPTPNDGSRLTTYVGCSFLLDLAAKDESNSFDVVIQMVSVRDCSKP